MRVLDVRSRNLLTGLSKGIYFDGLLPTSKFDVRLERLIAQTKRLATYYQANPIPCRAPPTVQGKALQSLFANPVVQPGLTHLPPPFLVPAVLEALAGTAHYKYITSVVPGEADLYCAGYLKKNGGIVFTGDSDLLLHDLGLDGAVGFLKDVETCSNGTPGKLCSRIYHPTRISDRLKLPKSHGLRAVAFEIVLDNHATFPKLLMQATALRAIKTYEDKYTDFEKEYVSLPSDSIFEIDNEVRKNVKVRSVLQSLDPRISEYVLQFPCLAETAGRFTRGGSLASETPHVFLPFLLDCPVRTNAWEISTSTRQLAYGLINLVIPKRQQQSSVFEHRTQQGKSGGREWQLPKFSEISDACTSLVNVLDRLHEKLPKLSSADFWIAVTVYQDIDWSAFHSKTSSSQLVSEQLIDSEKPNNPYNYSWDIVHFIAQIQGSHYSFRFLKQILGLLISYDDFHGSFPEPVFLLQRHLETFPPLNDFPDLRNVFAIVQKIEARGILKVVHELLGIAQPGSSPVQESTKAAKKKRKRSQAPSDSSVRQRKSTNPFELLGVE